MDAFSLAVSFGTLEFSLKKCFLISFIVGVFHFFMPLIGSVVGNSFINLLQINTHFLSGIIFSYIAIQMIKEFKSEDNETFNMNFLGTIMFALGVSLDSFGVGFTFNSSILFLVKTTTIFAICSFLFTFLGLYLGRLINKLIGYYAVLFGAVIMVILALINFVNFCSLN